VQQGGGSYGPPPSLLSQQGHGRTYCSSSKKTYLTSASCLRDHRAGGLRARVRGRSCVFDRNLQPITTTHVTEWHLHRALRCGAGEAAFSELAGREAAGESFVTDRRGRPVVALVLPDSLVGRHLGSPPRGLAAVAGALAEWDDLKPVMADVVASSRTARDRPAPFMEFGCTASTPTS
jgi:hypothetical protein